ncbi:MAG: hypothetical protein COW70_06890 [Hydrogenophilales bacterium CG18_big_fil_WC_8_21_14_2_50_58_12]|nr:MAG: hypothetical protein COW70_06890 [Hydrogenophilales bacterium CG18_big_fil_WC_8_21_14_2_50_58_12]
MLTSLIALAALCDFLYFLPFVGDISKQAYSLSLMLSLASVAMFVFTLINSGRINLHKVMIAFWMLMTFFWLYPLSLWRLALYAGLVVILMLKKDRQRLAFEKFRTIFCLIILINLLAYPIVSQGMIHSIGSINSSYLGKQLTGMYYENFGITFVLHGLGNTLQIGNTFLYRMSAWFEEPGNVGTIGALLLAATGFKMDWKGKVLLVGGVLSFSLAFFVIVILYTAIKKPKAFLYLMGVLIFTIWYFQDNEFVSSKLIDRISISDQGVSGDNRTVAAFDKEFKEFSETPGVWFGHDEEQQTSQLEYFSSSWKNIVWDYGIVGLVMLISIFVLVFLHELRESPGKRFLRMKQLLPFLLVFLLNIYQRPYVLTLSYFLIFVGAMIWEISEIAVGSAGAKNELPSAVVAGHQRRLLRNL